MLAGPFSYWMAEYWMRAFDYHTGISWTVFIAALFITLAISGIILFIQSRKVAIVNPAKILKYE
jgi:ABC-type antimicrobial peptide transport system permease subunit